MTIEHGLGFAFVLIILLWIGAVSLAKEVRDLQEKTKALEKKINK